MENYNYHDMTDEQLEYAYQYITEQLAIAIGEHLYFWENQLVEISKVLEARNETSPLINTHDAHYDELDYYDYDEEDEL